MFKVMLKMIAIGVLFFGGQPLLVAEDKPVAPVKTLLKENRIEEAVAICHQYEVLSTRDKDDRFVCAWVYLRSNKLDLADKILEEQKANSKTSEYQLIRGYRLGLEKKYEEAKKIFETVAGASKGRTEGTQAQELIGELYEMQDKLPTAAFVYNLALKEDQTRGYAAWGLARFYQNQNDIKRCIQYSEITTKLWPRHIPSRFLLAKIYFALGPEYVSQGFNWLKESYRLNRSNPEVLEEIGSFFERKNKIPEAVKYWEKALKVNPNLSLANEKVKEYFSQSIKELMVEEKYAEVIEKFEKNPGLSESPEMLLLKGQSLRNLGKYNEAIIALKQFLKTDPKNALANRELGICYVNQKSWDLAVDAFGIAVRTESENAINIGWFAYALEEKGELRKAKEYWEKALALFEDPQQREKASRKIASITKRIEKTNKKEEDDDE